MQFGRIWNVGLSTLLCAALGSNIASAATLRMVIQSHPDVGGKCIDVPYSQLFIGMRLQMWDCNNSPAQIFVYEDQSQVLRIGTMCVGSWGRGDPQDQSVSVPATAKPINIGGS